MFFMFITAAVLAEICSALVSARPRSIPNLRLQCLDVAPERFHLHMGCRKRGSKVRPLRWDNCRMVDLYRLDDILSLELSGK